MRHADLMSRCVILHRCHYCRFAFILIFFYFRRHFLFLSLRHFSAAAADAAIKRQITTTTNNGEARYMAMLVSPALI